MRAPGRRGAQNAAERRQPMSPTRLDVKVGIRRLKLGTVSKDKSIAARCSSSNFVRHLKGVMLGSGVAFIQ